MVGSIVHPFQIGFQRRGTYYGSKVRFRKSQIQSTWRRMHVAKTLWCEFPHLPKQSRLPRWKLCTLPKSVFEPDSLNGEHYCIDATAEAIASFAKARCQHRVFNDRRTKHGLCYWGPGSCQVPRFKNNVVAAAYRNHAPIRNKEMDMSLDVSVALQATSKLVKQSS